MFQQSSLPHNVLTAVMRHKAHSNVASPSHAISVTSAGERTTHSDRPSTYTPRLRSSRITRFCRSGFSRSLMTCQARGPRQFFAGCRASCQQPCSSAGILVGGSTGSAACRTTIGNSLTLQSNLMLQLK